MPFPATIAQRFFSQRLFEILARQTIDSHRLRVLNPILSLIEVKDIYQRLMQGSIKNEETLLSSVKECMSLLKGDQILHYQTVDKSYILEHVFSRINKESCRDHFKDMCFVIDTLLKENKNYCQALISKIKELIYAELGDDPFPTLLEIDLLTSQMVTELIRLGYSKSFLYSFCNSNMRTFRAERMDEFCHNLEQLPTQDSQEFIVWFKVYSPGLTENEWTTFNNWEVQSDISQIINYTGKDTNFTTPKRGHVFLGLRVIALDHFSGLQTAKQALSEILDMIQLAYHESIIDIGTGALVVNLENPDGAQVQKVKQLPDGKFPKGEGVLAKLGKKLSLVLENKTVSPETKEKIKSALRYLRYGNESLELEHQFINYWIGLEYLFSNDKETTFVRIKRILPVLHVLVYFQRNLIDFHRILAKLPVDSWEHFDANNANCLLQNNVLEEIRDKIFEDYPLRSYRAWRILNRIIKKQSGIKEYLEEHFLHLEWHLIRIYRVRNEIVHEAKYSFQNQTLASNLRYYLAFSLSIILDHFSNENNETADLDTFYSMNIFKYTHLKHAGYPLDKLIDFNHDFEMLS